jgi:hypothetical protein
MNTLENIHTPRLSAHLAAEKEQNLFAQLSAVPLLVVALPTGTPLSGKH